LRAREDKVEYLWEEEKKKRFREVGLDPYDREGHAGNVAQRVSRKRRCWVPRKYQKKLLTRLNEETPGF
jgi:hypothetical protein